MNIKSLFLDMLEYVGIYQTAFNLNQNEIKMIEAVRFPFYYKIISIKKEALTDAANLGVTIKRFIEKHCSHRIRRTVLTLSGSNVIPIFLTFPDIPKEKIASLINWEIEKHLPLRREDAIIHYHILSHSDNNGVRSWNILVICSRKDDVMKLTAAFDEAGVQVLDVSYLPLHVLGAMDFAQYRTGIGVVFFHGNFIMLALVKNSKIIHFSTLSGNYQTSSVVFKSILNYFTEVRSKEFDFLDEIIVTGDISSQDSEKLSRDLSESLNIIVTGAGADLFDPYYLKNNVKLGDMDLVSFMKGNEHLPRTSFNLFRKEKIADILIRTFVTLFVILDLAGLFIIPSFVMSFQKYQTYQKVKDVAPETISDPRLKKAAIQMKEISSLARYKKRQKELIRNIEEAKSSGIESSNIKSVLAEICRFIPQDVWLTDLSINNHNGEMKGVALNSDGLETFTGYFSGSAILKNVVLKKVDLVDNQGKSVLQFTISFGVTQ